MTLPRSVMWKDGRLTLLDQRQLPAHTIMIHCESVDDVYQAIVRLAVRGAPAIGIAAAYGLLIDLDGVPYEQQRSTLIGRAEKLTSARPTAVNLSWAMRRMLAVQEGDGYFHRLENEARAIHEEDRLACREIGRHGASLLPQGARVLTHCNAGSLAVSEYGTALAPIYYAFEQGKPLHVFVDETRPLLQGSRLTAYELVQSGVPCTLITDSMAAHLMACGEIDLVLVGADRVAANGDVANKIGTLSLAIACQYFSIPFYVACPTSTIDLDTASGEGITIEERSGEEVSHLAGTAISVPGIPVRNPAFDVTPSALVTAIITERKVLQREPGNDGIKLEL